MLTVHGRQLILVMYEMEWSFHAFASTYPPSYELHYIWIAFVLADLGYTYSTPLKYGYLSLKLESQRDGQQNESKCLSL